MSTGVVAGIKLASEERKVEEGVDYGTQRRCEQGGRKATTSILLQY